MISHALMVLCFVAPMSLEEARQLTQARHAVFDKLRISFYSLTYTSERAEDRHDPAAWRPTENIAHTHTIAIVRPGFLHEWLTDDPMRGYEPVSNSVCEGKYIRRWSRPLSTGETKYHVDETTTHNAPFTWLPLPWIFDLQLPDSLDASLNTLELLNHPSARVTGIVDGLTRIHAEIPAPQGHAFTLVCDVDLNDRATPMRAVVTVDYDDPALQSGTWEMTTDSVIPFHGFELPMVATVTIRNPNVSSGAGVHRFEVTCFEEDPALTPQDVCIVPEPANALVTTRMLTPYDHQITIRYDGHGVATERIETYGVADPISAPLAASAFSWRMGIPASLGLFGLVAAGCLIGARRR